jgi:hypothetical protein
METRAVDSGGTDHVMSSMFSTSMSSTTSRFASETKRTTHTPLTTLPFQAAVSERARKCGDPCTASTLLWRARFAEAV